jgi:RNA polymerase sigma-70 factor (ECF subfamily)
MLFVCCDEGLPVESQLVLALKTLCGFGVAEIAVRLFTTEANVYKRLGRARQRLRDAPPDPELTDERLRARLPAVQSVLYLLFTEGHLSAHPKGAIRRELCAEAIRLAEVLARQPVTGTPDTFALLALFHLQLARLDAREDEQGNLLLLESQDRSRWDPEEIAVGLGWLARSAAGVVFSRYHAEAGIAAEHCRAATFSETRWDRIVECYALLESFQPSPVHALNRAVAMAEWRGAAHGLAALEGLDPPSWLADSYLWPAVLADLHRRCGHVAEANRHRGAALALAPAGAVRAALERRLGAHPTVG